ncbi:hypothetical protein MATL_G00085600 [Megalops atlanticus]|uniref:DUF4174 domain-containing protein n=1 Tax=Megalops atlanticus TaxID=7932 RepID=A0A9D3TDX8_MEGAT|nr:hypothetical protein MATL_G00085600 [Megalops atlanticus]
MPRVPWSLLLLLTLWSPVALSVAQQLERPHQSRSQLGLAGKMDLSPPAEVDSQTDRKLEVPDPSITPELDFLAEFAGKNRLWVITAPSYTDNYLRMMEKQIQDMEYEGLSCRLAERDTLIVTIIQNAMMEGKIRRPTFQGEATEEAIDSDMVTKLLHYLQLEDVFSMLILKKNLKVGERFPYPVRVEAVLEIIDQLPMRKLEKMTRKGSKERCKVVKKRVVAQKRGSMKKTTFSPLRQGNFTLVPKQRKPLDKKAALRNKVQDILSGRSRFVIRKASAGPKGTQISSTDRADPRSSGENAGKKTTGENVDSASISEGTQDNKQDPAAEVEERRNGANSSGDKGEEDSNSSSKSKSKKKGKGKKKDGKKKKGKGGGKKSQRDANEKEKKILKVFLETFQGKRRLMVITAPAKNSPQYIQQKSENEQNHCDLALRKVSMVAILGSEHNGTLYLQHYQLDTEPPFGSDPDKSTNPELISQIRKEYGMLPKAFSLVLTDYDLKPKRISEAPITSSVLRNYIDSFPSRQPEKRRERSEPVTCSKPEHQSSAESSLLRFISKRRLLIISAPSEDDYSYQQQLQALNGQSCPMGIRHFALLKLVGAGPTATGSVELFPLNGKSQSENEPLSGDMVNGMRGHLKINREYFNMLVVGKDGDVKAWFPSPMWSLANIYDLVDSMELRQQEQKLQKTLGIHCPEDTSSSFHGYEDLGEERYLYHRSED